MIEADEIHYGMKKLALHNWREPDVPKSFPEFTEQIWLSAAMEPGLIAAVPESVVRLFEVARGSILYGWFFYPLLTLASEQLHRVQETAVRERCAVAGIPLTVQTKKGMRDRSFDSLINELSARGVIRDEELPAWDSTRQLRNWSSHPKSQSILTPGHALAGIEATARHINQLFSANPDYFSHLGLRVRKATGLDEEARERPVVVGIDVGAPNNGYHLVALRGAAIVGVAHTVDPAEAAQWCHGNGAKLVAIDAPSGWRATGERNCREAEEMLSRMGYSSYPTPRREVAVADDQYAWMLNGERLYAALAGDYTLFRGKELDVPFCFETYPYLASCAFSGRKLKADSKNCDRRDILRAAGIMDQMLSNIDYVDAAVCALVACSVSIDYWSVCGNPDEGFIVSPPLR